MPCDMLAASTLDNVLELIGLVVVFVLILFAAYYCTKLIGRYSYNQFQAGNIEVIETFNISQAKHIQIIRVGMNKYIAIAVCKDSITKLADLTEEDIEIVKKEKNKDKTVFADVLNRMKKTKRSEERR